MSNNTFYKEIENEIKTALSDGLKKGDFSGLNKAISNSVDVVLDEATSRLENGTKKSAADITKSADKIAENYKKGTATYERKLQLERERAERAANAARTINAAKTSYTGGSSFERKPMNISKSLPVTIYNNKGMFLSVFEIILGGAGVVFNLLLTAILLGIGGYLASSIFTMLISGGFGFLLGHGIKTNGLLSRAKRYAALSARNGYSTLSNLAASTGISEKKILKDIKKLLNRGNFPQGHIDSKETTFMITDSVFNDYVASMENVRQLEAKKQAESTSNEAVTGDMTSEEQAEFNTMMSDGLSAVKRLHELNDSIPGEVISNKLQRLEDLLKQIFERVKEHPEQMGRMHKLMDYYLPTMLKLVEAYDEYDKVIAPGKEITDAKNEIEKTLDTINDAFVTLLNNLFQDSVWDVTSDAKVLKTMLAQDGLSE